MRWKIVAFIPALWATAALAQEATTPSNDDANKATAAADPGRPIPDDRGGLSSRGGTDPIGSRKTYSATLGSMIYSTIGKPMGSTLPSHPQ